MQHGFEGIAFERAILIYKAVPGVDETEALGFTCPTSEKLAQITQFIFSE
jgi:hypothetical protein